MQPGRINAQNFQSSSREEVTPSQLNMMDEMRHMFTVLKTENEDLRREIISLKDEKEQPPTSNDHFRPPGISLPHTSCNDQYRPPFPQTRPTSPTSSIANDVLIQTRLHQNKAFKQAKLELPHSRLKVGLILVQQQIFLFS